MEGYSATTGYFNERVVGRAQITQPQTLTEALAYIDVLLKEQGQLRLKLEKTERLLNEISEAYREISEEYFKAKKVALRILNNRGRR